MAKPFIVDGTDCTWHSPNKRSDYYYMTLRMLSRSGKIMNALSSTHGSFRRDTVGIRKSLNFDSSPSPKENSSNDDNSTSSINTNTSSSILNLSSVESIDSNAPMTSVESIDENQNQTPQQNRKSSYRIDIKNNTCIQSRTLHLMSLVKEQWEATNKNTNCGSLRPSCSFNLFTGSKGPHHIVTASTPRNLSQEFNQALDDRPHTPENIINVIPESISSIKKSHKKEKLYSHEVQSSTQQMDTSVKTSNLHSRTTMESPEIDMIATSSCYVASKNESQKKNRSTKRTLIYDDERCTESDFNHSVQQKTTSTRNALLESGLDHIESDMLQQGINSIDGDCEEDNVCNEEVSQSLQNESSGICNINVISENRMVSPESSSSISQNANRVVTPENNLNILKQVLTESIKKSHKKIKHENRKMLFKTPSKDLYKKIGLTKSDISLEGVYNIDENIESQASDAIHTSGPQNSEFDRPSTPENVNSSRLLLLDFNSVKKSHKKDKCSKKASSFVECHDYKYYKKNSDSLQSKYEEKIYTTLHKTKPLELEESPGVPPKKKLVNTFLQSSTPKLPSDSKSSECKDINDEFQIFTPIKKRRIPIDVINYVCAVDYGYASQEADEPVQTTAKEIDCSRCVTPVACFKLKEHEDLASGRDNAKRSETDKSVLKVADTANLKDKNGRSTPTNMSTTELFCNVDSIKKSHKKDKHNRSNRLILKKKQLCIEKSEHVNFENNDKMLEKPTSWSLKYHFDKNCTEKEMREKEKNKSYEEIAYDDPDNPQPSTSRGAVNMKDVKNITKSKFLDTTPPNSLSAINLMKLVQTTSIKKSHKKVRDINAQTKYILMNQEHELSDDGSIFDEEERLNFQNDSITQDDM
ncbi:PREDICTED: uncharacterized protein LOC108775614 [Cyphomyrmex costatus]|uniref:Uncharacterized protein n=1 Tax=Cyphomyrmex costatus TaxID=456900 RepID=A0A151IQ22_9HYME|nr:PREDICTED: uncharacterized protein LOC108775614 [Cyphomyrmex costatus]KYN08247.1 hypothetical protein ALC62_00772 [Cyphomyrmex costatus]